MKYIVSILIFILFSCYTKEKGTVIEKEWFEDDNTYVILCKGYPKEGISGKARIETAKEAALINAQFYAKNIFDDTVNVITNGTIKNFKIYEDHVIIHYVIEHKNLRRLMNKK